MSFLNKFKMLTSAKYMYALGVGDSVVTLAALQACPREESQDLYHAGSYWRLVENDSMVVQSADYAEAITEILLKNKHLKFKKAPIQVVLSSELVEQVTIDRPELPPSDIAPSLQWSLRELVSIPATDMLVDYFDPPVQATPNKQIHVVAASRQAVMPMVSALHEFGLKITGIIHADLIFGHWPAQGRRVMLISQMPQERAQLNIVANGRSFVTRRLRHSYDMNTIDPGDTEMMENLALELQRSLDFYSGPMRQVQVSEIELLVDNERAQDLCQAISVQLGIPVKLSPYPEWARNFQKEDYSDLLAIGGLQWVLANDALQDRAELKATAREANA
ncbi:hypothetical protein [Aliidiomarina sanyensis]|uniref:MSHA biogenesis protein MshI n=1 Tax=Aliidiomarina sanyensis TaxID=1249555 RepID=A0A432WI11_9GAMM|nr:hypothetical protein [Aliidiomarina sanyensis]RUO33430.1 hypothetical protein CWE11_06185 [Aliidiomarina sanyensis]